MQNEQSSPYANSTSDMDSRDNELWRIAKRRAAFKISAFSYVTVNCMLIAIWYFTSGPGSYFWPVWPMLGWGIGVATQYFHAYHGSDIFSTQKKSTIMKKIFLSFTLLMMTVASFAQSDKFRTTMKTNLAMFDSIKTPN